MRRFAWPILLVFLLFLSNTPLGAVSGWNQIDTLHTRIIFADENVGEANELAAYADEVFASLSAFLEHRPKERVPVILMGHTSWANGYYVTFPSAVSLTITSPSNRFLGTRTQDWLRSVYTHELTHYLHLTSLVGPAKYLRFLGPAVTAMNIPFMSGWWIEGVTTYSETAFAAHGGRGDSPTFAHRYLAPLSEGRMWSLAQGGYASLFAPSDRIYLTGYLMVDYLSRQYGEESFALINRKFAAFPFFGLSPSIKKVTGHSAKEIFSFALTEKREMGIAASASSLFHRQEEGDHYLFFDTAVGLVGLFDSPTKGTLLVRYSEDGERETLRPLALESGSSLSLAQTTGLFSLVWADGRDGRGLPTGPVSYSDLYLLDLATLTERRLTERQRLVHPAISGDGTRALASEIRSSFYDLVEIDLSTGVVETLLTDERTSYLEPALSRDGSLMAVIAAKEGNSTLLIGDGTHFHAIVGPTASELSGPRFIDDHTLFYIGEGVLHRYDIEEGTSVTLQSDPLGVYDAMLLSGVLYYQSYSSRGFVIKEGRAEERETGAFLLPLDPPSSTPTLQYPAKPFSDRLHFNLALPYPFVEANRFQPGIYFHLSSLLRRQSLVGMVGLSIDAMEAVVDLTYQALIGSMGFDLQFASNGPAISLSATLSAPLLHMTTVRSQQLLRVQGGVSMAYEKKSFQATPSAALQYVIQSNDRRQSDFYGPSSVSATASTLLYSDSDALVGALSVSGQSRLFSSSVMAKAALTIAAVTPSTWNIGDLLRLFSFSSSLKSSMPAHLSAGLRIPLGRLDIPIPYGGLTGAGLEVEVQKTLALENPRLDFESGWAVGATLTAGLVLGGTSSPFRPFVTAAYLLEEQSFLLSIGLNLVPLFEVISLH